MNTIEFKLDYTLAENELDFELWINLIIDGTSIFADSEGNAVSFPDLFNSFYKDGNYYILTCDCGIPSCAGFYKPTEVRRVNETIYWNIPEPITKQLKFSFKQFKESVLNFRSELLALNQSDEVSSFQHVPEYNLKYLQEFMYARMPDGRMDTIYPYKAFTYQKKH